MKLRLSLATSIIICEGDLGRVPGLQCVGRDVMLAEPHSLVGF